MMQNTTRQAETTTLDEYSSDTTTTCGLKKPARCSSESLALYKVHLMDISLITNNI